VTGQTGGLGLPAPRAADARGTRAGWRLLLGEEGADLPGDDLGLAAAGVGAAGVAIAPASAAGQAVSPVGLMQPASPAAGSGRRKATLKAAAVMASAIMAQACGSCGVRLRLPRAAPRRRSFMIRVRNGVAS
jgi:hypothetical protein